MKDVSIKGTIIELDDEKLLHGVFRDITDQKERERELRRERKRFQEIFNNVNDAIYLHKLTDEGQ